MCSVCAGQMFKWFEDLPLEDMYREDSGRQQGTFKDSSNLEALQVLQDLMVPTFASTDEGDHQRCGLNQHLSFAEPVGQ